MKNSTCSRSSATVSRSREFSAVCHPEVISARMRSQIVRVSAAVRDSPIRPSSSCAIFCCLRRIVRRVDSVGCAVNTGSIHISSISRRTSASSSPCFFSRVMASSMPPGWVVPSFRYWRRRRMRCTFSAMLTISNQVEKARTRSRASAAGTSRVRVFSSAAPLASPSRRAMAAWRSRLHSLEQRIAALLPNNLADQRAEHVHVFAQLGVFERKARYRSEACRCSRKRRAVYQSLRKTTHEPTRTDRGIPRRHGARDSAVPQAAPELGSRIPRSGRSDRPMGTADHRGCRRCPAHRRIRRRAAAVRDRPGTATLTPARDAALGIRPRTRAGERHDAGVRADCALGGPAAGDCVRRSASRCRCPRRRWYCNCWRSVSNSTRITAARASRSCCSRTSR